MFLIYSYEIVRSSKIHILSFLDARNTKLLLGAVRMNKEQDLRIEVIFYFLEYNLTSSYALKSTFSNLL